MLPVTQYEFDMLGAALDQGGWKIECQLPRKGVQKILDILNFDLGQVSNASCNSTTLDLYLRNGKEKQEHFTGKIRRVLIEGQLGIIDSELRRFAVSFYHLPEKSRRQARESAEYWRKLGPGIGFGLVFVRDKNAPPGWPLHKHLQYRQHPSYGFEEHLRRYGSGDNLLRTSRISQPGVLQVGDVLGTGDRVLSEPRRGYNSSVLIHITGGTNGHWINVAPRLPLALLTKEDNPPKEMWLLG